ncbi:MAG: IclR family transcriptional regulator [Pseudonocardiaceae bacterium]
MSEVARPTDVVGKALSLLTRLGEFPDGVAASELARQVGLPLSTAHRLLGMLVREGYARFDPASRCYTLGLRVFQLAQGIAHAYGFTAVVRRELEQVSLTTREATLLAVLDREKLLYVYSIEGPQQVRVVGDPGRHGPLHCTSLGKVLIAFAPAPVREHLTHTVPMEVCGPNAITDREQFIAEIAQVRARGYAVADEEHEPGIRAVSVPVFGTRDGVAALSTAAPAYRMSVAQLEALVPRLNEAARSLAALMPLG